jgi:hypothetical protein
MWRVTRPLWGARPAALLPTARRDAAPAWGAAAGAAGGTGAAGAAGGAAAVARRAAGGWRAGAPAPAPAWGARGLATKTTVKKKVAPAKGGKDKKGKDVKKGGKDAKKSSGKGGRTLTGFGSGEDGMPSNSLLNEWALKVLRAMPLLPKTPLSADEIARHKAVATEYSRQTMFRNQRNRMFIRQRFELKNAAIKTMDPAEWAEIQKGGVLGGAIKAPPHRHMPFWTPPIVV